MTITVNGQELYTDRVLLTYEHVLRLADMQYGASMTWKWGEQGGCLAGGDSVFAQEGMTFRVVRTGNA